MQKTKLGITVGLFGAALFFICGFGGFTAAILLAGYALLFEENAWLKRAAVKGVALMLGFAVFTAIIYLIPDLIAFIDKVLNIFGGHFHIAFISNIVVAINDAIDIIQKVLFIVLGLKAFNQGAIKIPVIDSLVNKYMD